MQVLLAHQADIKLEGVEVSKAYLAAFTRVQGLQVASRAPALLPLHVRLLCAGEHRVCTAIDACQLSTQHALPQWFAYCQPHNLDPAWAAAAAPLASTQCCPPPVAPPEACSPAQVATVYALPAGGAAPRRLEGGQLLQFEEPAYELGPGDQGDFDSDILRLEYTSLTTPATELDHNMATGSRCVLMHVAPWQLPAECSTGEGGGGEGRAGQHLELHAPLPCTSGVQRPGGCQKRVRVLEPHRACRPEPELAPCKDA